MSERTQYKLAWAVWHSEWGDMKCLVNKADADTIRAMVSRQWMTEAFESRLDGDALQSAGVIYLYADRQEFAIGEDVIVVENFEYNPIYFSNWGRWKIPKVISHDVRHEFIVDGVPLWAID